MVDLSVNVRLRPIRIGYLVNSSDMESVRQIMRVNACLWGGQYNPIIPIFDDIPSMWQEEGVTEQQVTQGYINFFEPDVYVESQEGLLEKAGLGSIREGYFDPLVGKP